MTTNKDQTVYQQLAFQTMPLRSDLLEQHQSLNIYIVQGEKLRGLLRTHGTMQEVNLQIEREHLQES